MGTNLGRNANGLFAATHVVWARWGSCGGQPESMVRLRSKGHRKLSNSGDWRVTVTPRCESYSLSSDDEEIAQV